MPDSILLTFGPDMSTAVASVPILDDDSFELAETFSGNLRLPAAAGITETVMFKPQKANSTIMDNDGK